MGLGTSDRTMRFIFANWMAEIRARVCEQDGEEVFNDNSRSSRYMTATPWLI
jgi:hypothetical protein